MLKRMLKNINKSVDKLGNTYTNYYVKKTKQ